MRIKIFVNTQKVKLIVAKKNLTVTDFAKKMGVASCNIYAIINANREASAGFRRKLMEVLDVTEEKFDEIFVVKEEISDRTAA